MAKKGSKKPKKNSIPNEENIVVQDIEEPKDISNNANEKIDTTDTQLENSVSQDIVAEVLSTEEVIEAHDETTTEEVIEAIEETVIEENSSTEEIAETTEIVEQNSSLVNETETTIPQDDNIIDVETAETVLEEPKQVSKRSFFIKFKENWKKMMNWLHQHMLVYRLLQITLCIFLFIGANVATSALTYYGYIQYKHYRIDDSLELDVERNRTWYLTTGTKYTVVTMDIASGVAVPAYSNINATGKMNDGKTTKGEYNYGIDETTVIENMTKLQNYVRQLDVDFFSFQNVDVASTRSYMVNQYEYLNEALARYSRVAARFHHTQYLVYPFKNPIGLINSDLMTYSRYKTTYGLRMQLPIDTTFHSRLAAEDACFSLALMPVNGTDSKYLVILNVDLDENPTIRKQQMDVLNDFMLEEYEYGSYVIVAGNFNSDTATNDGTFANQQQKPSWLSDFDESQLVEGFTFVHPKNEAELATYRSLDLPYENGVNYQAHTSGFIISNNIKAESVILDTNYEYSNHNPVKLTFSLIKPSKKK